MFLVVVLTVAGTESDGKTMMTYVHLSVASLKKKLKSYLSTKANIP